VEPVTVGCAPDRLDRARAALSDAVRLIELPSDDAWMRDVGPTILRRDDGDRLAVDWTFNAWGGAVHGLYDDWTEDDRVAGRVAAVEGLTTARCPLILEGGAIHTDGRGTLFVTRECVMSAGRNANRPRAEVEALLTGYTGCERIVWLDQGVYQDETTGHVDNLLHVVGPDRILLTWPDDESDPQRPRSEAARRVLEALRTPDGAPYRVDLLPMPGPLFLSAAEAAGLTPEPGAKPRRAGDRLAGSYANLYLAGSGDRRRAIVPLLDPATDGRAQEIIAAALPDHEIVGVPAREILLGGGNIHCITQQIPA